MTPLTSAQNEWVITVCLHAIPGIETKLGRMMNRAERLVMINEVLRHLERMRTIH